MGMWHEDTVKKYDGSLGELAEDIGNLKYDALEQLLFQIAAKLKLDSGADEKRGRSNLAAALFFASNNIWESSLCIAKAWKISEPYMKPKDD
jgi:hypothetical protein